jgi:hypothetical protein
MAVIEIRILDMVDTDRIEAVGMTGASDEWVVLARAPHSAPPAPHRASTPRPKMFSLDYAGWHERLAGQTRTA